MAKMRAMSLLVFLFIFKEALSDTGEGKGFHLGSTDFKSLRNQKARLVDKTNFIADFLKDEATHVLITRPQGFGKSFAHSMLYHFLNIKDNTTELFKGTNIAENQIICRKHQNQHPVIRISFGELRRAKTSDEAKTQLQVAFNRMLQDHYYLITEKPKLSGVPEGEQKKWFDKVTEAEALTFPALESTIHTLSKYVHNHFGKRAMILIDDYDSLVHAAYLNNYLEKVTYIHISMYLRSLENNTFLEKSLILGVILVDDRNTLYGIGNQKSYSVIDSEYSSYFGFSKAETDQLILDYKLSSGLIESMVRKYNGYRFGDSLMLNPWSVTHCLKRNGDLSNYWISSGRYGDFEKLLNAEFTSRYGMLPILETELLLNRFSVNRSYKKRLSYPPNPFPEFFFRTFESLAIDSGYLTVIEKNKEENRLYKCRVAVPNEEILEAYRRFLDNFFADESNVKSSPYKNLTKVILSKNATSTLEHFKTYVHNALKSLSEGQRGDPIVLVDQFLKAFFARLNKFYEKVRIRDDKLPWSITGLLLKGPGEISVGFAFGYKPDCPALPRIMYHINNLRYYVQNDEIILCGERLHYCVSVHVPWYKDIFRKDNN